MISDVIKTILPAITAFIIGVVMTPILTNFLYRKHMWKEKSVAKTIDGKEATISQTLHKDEERRVPRMGGIIVWGSVLLVTFGMFMLSLFSDNEALAKLSYLSRNQTWLPLFVLIATSLFGLIDDYLVCRKEGGYVGGGLSLRLRLLFVTAIGIIGAWWFAIKLGYTAIFIPSFGAIELGWLFVPFFVIVMIALYSGSIIDGIDGLAGGVFGSIFAGYAIIAFSNGQIDIAAFCMALTGGLLAFLWFNIPPARYFLSETGTMGLTTTLVIIAFLTNAVFVLPIIAFPLIITSLSSIIQILSKKFRHGNKIFIVAPLHNHFQALGWPGYKVTMRYWIVSLICSIIGVIIMMVQ